MKVTAHIVLVVLGAAIIYLSGAILAEFGSSPEFQVSGAASALSILFLGASVIAPKKKSALIVVSLVLCFFAVSALLFHIGKPEGYIASWDIVGLPSWMFVVFQWFTFSSPLLVALLLIRKEGRTNRSSQRVSALRTDTRGSS